MKIEHIRTFLEISDCRNFNRAAENLHATQSTVSTRVKAMEDRFGRSQLKTPYRDGTTHVIFEPLDFIARLVALVPKPWVNLTRFHGVFAHNNAHRAWVTPAQRGKDSQPKRADGQDEKTHVQRHAAMIWAQRLKRVFNIDIEKCRICGGTAKVIACIEDPVIIKKILTYLEQKLPMRAALLLRGKQGEWAVNGSSIEVDSSEQSFCSYYTLPETAAVQFGLGLDCIRIC